MGLFNFFSMNSSQQSMQQEMNQNMLSALQAQLQKTTWPTARNQLIAQINNLQQQTTQNIAQTPPQVQVTNQEPTQAPSNQMPSQAPQATPGLSQQKVFELNDIENEITTIRIALTRIELAVKKLKQ